MRGSTLGRGTSQSCILSTGLAEAGRHAPRRVVTKKGKLTLNYTDHYPVMVELEMPKSSQGMDPQKNNWSGIQASQEVGMPLKRPVKGKQKSFVNEPKMRSTQVKTY